MSMPLIDILVDDTLVLMSDYLEYANGIITQPYRKYNTDSKIFRRIHIIDNLEFLFP
jgi:hypothetical protein